MSHEFMSLWAGVICCESDNTDHMEACEKKNSELWEINSELLDISSKQNCEIKSHNYCFYFYFFDRKKNSKFSEKSQELHDVNSELSYKLAIARKKVQILNWHLSILPFLYLAIKPPFNLGILFSELQETKSEMWVIHRILSCFWVFKLMKGWAKMSN